MYLTAGAYWSIIKRMQLVSLLRQTGDINMKIMHISDLHLGKKLNEFSLIEDQRYILDRILDIADEEDPYAVVIAGDVYDKAVPPSEAVTLFDNFLVELTRREKCVFIISGNHDSAERISFGGRLMDRAGVYVSRVFDGDISPVRLSDEYGDVCFWLLPFIRPVNVKLCPEYEDEQIQSYEDAVKAVISHMDIDPTERNVLVAHQFVTGAQRSDSESFNVGGLDKVGAEVFNAFDYTALGHIHKPQDAGKNVRYCGTPLKYSLSEAGQEKSVTVVELHEKGSVDVRVVPLVPLHDLRELRGTYEELMTRDNYAGTAVDDYIYVTLTDDTDVPNVINKLRSVYRNVMDVRYDNSRTRAGQGSIPARSREHRTPAEIFGELFEKMNGKKMTPEQEKIAQDIFEEIGGDI